MKLSFRVKNKKWPNITKWPNAFFHGRSAVEEAKCFKIGHEMANLATLGSTKSIAFMGKCLVYKQRANVTSQRIHGIPQHRDDSRGKVTEQTVIQLVSFHQQLHIALWQVVKALFDCVSVVQVCRAAPVMNIRNIAFLYNVFQIISQSLEASNEVVPYVARIAQCVVWAPVSVRVQIGHRLFQKQLDETVQLGQVLIRPARFGFRQKLFH